MWCQQCLTTAITHFNYCNSCAVSPMYVCYKCTFHVSSGVYYGFSFHTSNVAGNDYINLALGAAVEFPALTMCLLTLGRVGRRIPLCPSLILSGISLFYICIVTFRWISVVRHSCWILNVIFYFFNNFSDRWYSGGRRPSDFWEVHHLTILCYHISVLRWSLSNNCSVSRLWIGPFVWTNRNYAGIFCTDVRKKIKISKLFCANIGRNSFLWTVSRHLLYAFMYFFF